MPSLVRLYIVGYKITSAYIAKFQHSVVRLELLSCSLQRLINIKSRCNSYRLHLNSLSPITLFPPSLQIFVIKDSNINTYKVTDF